MAIFKKILPFFLFFILFFTNLYLIVFHYFNIKKISQQQKILSEISRYKNNNRDKQFSISAAPLVLGAMETSIELADGRVANLQNFFRQHNSPLYDSAEYIVTVSDTYGFDYRLLPAIAMQESNLCKYIPDDSYNCWGYGIYGNQVLKFSSLKEAIDTVAKGLKKNYLDQGYTTPETIMQKYTPSSKGSWANGINYFLHLLD